MYIFLLCLFQPKVQQRRLSVWSKLCYAVGGAPYQITGSALGFFLQIYLLDVAQVTENTATLQEYTVTSGAILQDSVLLLLFFSLS